MAKKESQIIPVVTIDGPGGAGKGTISQLLAKELGFHLLDSGALYRVLALSVDNHGIGLDDEEALGVLAEHMDVQFNATEPESPSEIVLEGEVVTKAIRQEHVGRLASKVAAISPVRAALLTRQRSFREYPGLIADGRDMGTVVFTDATLKVFLTASAEERAQRRYKQLKDSGNDVSLRRLEASIRARDEQDTNRNIAPLRPADDALILDSTDLTIEQVYQKILDETKQRLKA